jgi:GNAT superfamily N-acetyltransferase
MPASAGLRFRAAGPGDANAIAGLHADSWQRHYRGAFSDAFLDNDVARYLDNLHVAHGLKRQGTGTRLLALTGQEVVNWSPSSGLYLWVLEQNRMPVPSTRRGAVPAWSAPKPRRQEETQPG